MSAITDPLATLIAARRDEDPWFEIIGDKLVELPPMGAIASILASRLASFINAFAFPRLGEAVVEVLFRLEPLNRNRRPDVAYVSFDRWPKDKAVPPHDNAWNVIPDLAIEVVSHHDSAEELPEKIPEYFQAGVLRVWVAYPVQQTIHVYAALDKITVCDCDGTLPGDPVLPEFQLPLREVFPSV